MEQTSFTYDRELEVNGGSNTDRTLVPVLPDVGAESVEESTRREHLILAWIKGELHLCAGAPTRTSGEWRLSDTSGKHHLVPFPLFTLNIYI